MYLLVTVKDTSQISDAITVLLQSGFTQFTTGETMEDICTECQSRKEHCQMNTTSSFTEEIKPEKMCSEVGIKMEEPGVPAEDLLFGDDYEDEIDDIEPDYLDMEPTSSRRSNAPVHLADDLDYSELGDSTQYSDLNDEEDNALDMANSLSLQNRKRKIDKNGGAVASLCASIFGEKPTPSGKTYEAIRAPSKKGQRDILMYRFGDKCYRFQFKHMKKEGHCYTCISCKNDKANPKSLPIGVSEGRFVEDPVALPHICEPKDWIKEMTERILMETLQKHRISEERQDSKQGFQRMLEEVYNDESIPSEERKALIAQLSDYKKFKQSFYHAWKRSRRSAVAPSDNEEGSKAFTDIPSKTE